MSWMRGEFIGFANLCFSRDDCYLLWPNSSKCSFVIQVVDFSIVLCDWKGEERSHLKRPHIFSVGCPQGGLLTSFTLLNKCKFLRVIAVPHLNRPNTPHYVIIFKSQGAQSLCEFWNLLCYGLWWRLRVKKRAAIWQYSRVQTWLTFGWGHMW